MKSGGEWIGSIDIENIAMAHPAVAMAACIGAFRPSGTSARCWWVKPDMPAALQAQIRDAALKAIAQPALRERLLEVGS